MRLERLLKAIYPPQCTNCDEPTEGNAGLCSECWSRTKFIMGTICDICGTPLPGEAESEVLHCDDCMKIARPWDKGRSVFVYEGVGRGLVLKLKHGDRTDIAPSAAVWMARIIEPIMGKNPIFVPVPLHPMRLLKRRYNQAALLSGAISKRLKAQHLPGALERSVRTKPLEGHSRDARFAALNGAIEVNKKFRNELKGRSIVLVDDVMTSGATLAACADVCIAASAKQICTVTLARVVKDV